MVFRWLLLGRNLNPCEDDRAVAAPVETENVNMILTDLGPPPHYRVAGSYRMESVSRLEPESVASSAFELTCNDLRTHFVWISTEPSLRGTCCSRVC
jgi:hypothetical protein